MSGRSVPPLAEASHLLPPINCATPVLVLWDDCCRGVLQALGYCSGLCSFHSGHWWKWRGSVTVQLCGPLCTLPNQTTPTLSGFLQSTRLAPSCIMYSPVSTLTPKYYTRCLCKVCVLENPKNFVVFLVWTLTKPPCCTEDLPHGNSSSSVLGRTLCGEWSLRDQVLMSANHGPSVVYFFLLLRHHTSWPSLIDFPLICWSINKWINCILIPIGCYFVTVLALDIHCIIM